MKCGWKFSKADGASPTYQVQLNLWRCWNCCQSATQWWAWRPKATRLMTSGTSEPSRLVNEMLVINMSNWTDAAEPSQEERTDILCILNLTDCFFSSWWRSVHPSLTYLYLPPPPPPNLHYSTVNTRSLLLYTRFTWILLDFTWSSCGSLLAPTPPPNSTASQLFRSAAVC